MNIVLGVKIEKALKDVKTAKELAKVLEELGIETTYLSLKGKEDEYLKLFKKRQQEIENIQKGYPAEREYL